MMDRDLTEEAAMPGLAGRASVVEGRFAMGLSDALQKAMQSGEPIPPAAVAIARVALVAAGREDSERALAEAWERVAHAGAAAVRTETAPAGLAWSDVGITFLRDKLKLSTEEIAQRTGLPRREIVVRLANLNAKGLRPGGRP
jgi:CRP-like cAMP-binding protein